jgi:type IV pilus assembly protein PilC
MPFIVTPRQFTQRAEFYHQLAQLTAAGLGVTNALEQINRHPPGHSFRKPLQIFLTELAQGKTLSNSLRCANWLPDFDLTLIEAGERSGRLDSCFRILADYYNERARLVKQILAQLAYPVFLIHFAAFIFWVVLPFAASQFNASILWLVVKAALKLSPLYLLTALIVIATQSKHGEKWRAFMETILNPVPVLGSARRSLALSRLSLSLEALISAGVNIVEAWGFAAVASNSPALRRAVEQWKPQLDAGRTPAELVKASSLFPESFANLYGSGEISGKLDETLRRLHVFYQEDGAHKLQLLAQWVPRGIYILVALIIAYKIITFYTGYFQQVNNMSHF